MLKTSVKITGDKELIAKFKRMEKAAQGQALLTAATAGILPIQNEAIKTVAVDEHDLQRSIHTEIIKSSASYAEVATGTDKEYAARIEFGFMDKTDSLGRHYNQPAQPYMRPAYDTKKKAAENETKAALLDLLNGVI